jgi:hypothetical protein
MKEYLILRLRNAAIAMDRKGDANMAALLTEAIDELEGPTRHTYGNSQVFDSEAEMVHALTHARHK